MEDEKLKSDAVGETSVADCSSSARLPRSGLDQVVLCQSLGRYCV